MDIVAAAVFLILLSHSVSAARFTSLSPIHINNKRLCVVVLQISCEQSERIQKTRRAIA